MFNLVVVATARLCQLLHDLVSDMLDMICIHIPPPCRPPACQTVLAGASIRNRFKLELVACSKQYSMLMSMSTYVDQCGITTICVSTDQSDPAQFMHVSWQQLM